MAKRRQDVEKRLTLFRCCGTCGKSFTTTADTPFVRQVPRDGKKMATTYYCSEECHKASYKHVGWFDGKAEERRKEREAKRDIHEKNRRYYAAHADEMRERRRKQYYADPEREKADRAYYRRKRALLAAEA